MMTTATETVRFIQVARIAVVGLVATAVVAGCVGGDRPARLKAAKEECAAHSSFISVLDEGDALSLAGEGEESAGADLLEMLCVLRELEIPDAVVSRMSQTRALDGTQEATWSGIRASWTYHPNSGLNIVLEEQR
jgi:hypothetical protein